MALGWMLLIEHKRGSGRENRDQGSIYAPDDGQNVGVMTATSLAEERCCCGGDGSRPPQEPAEPLSSSQ